MSEVNKEIRLDLMVNGTQKTFIQNHVPLSKALDYTDGEAKLFKKDKDGNDIEPTSRVLEEYRADFIAGLFDDKDLTKELVMEGLDTLDKHLIMDIILYRVLGYTKPEVEVPKEKKGAE